MTKFLPNHSRNPIFWAKMIFFVSFVLFLIFFTHLKPRIMVIHSLSESDPWVKSFNAGFQNSIKTGKTAPLSFQYLEAHTKLSELYKLKISVLMRQAIERFNPEVLVLCGEEAQDLIGRTYINDNHKNILFCGLRGSLADYGYEESRNVSGVFEQLPLQAFKDLIPLLGPKTLNEPLKLVFLGDNSELSKSLKQNFAAQDWTPYLFVDLVTVNTYEEWKNAVYQLSIKGHILFLAEYKQIYKDDNRTAVKNAQEVVKWTTQNASIPIIGLSNSYVQEGGLLALTVSPVGQGKSIASLTQELLNGKEPAQLTPHYNQDFLIRLQQNVSDKILPLPVIYSAFDRAVTNYD